MSDETEAIESTEAGCTAAVTAPAGGPRITFRDTLHVTCQIPFIGQGVTIDAALADLIRNIRSEYPDFDGDVGVVEFDTSTSYNVAGDQMAARWRAWATVRATKKIEPWPRP